MSFFEKGLNRIRKLTGTEKPVQPSPLDATIQSPKRDAAAPVESGVVQNRNFGSYTEPGIQNGEKESTFRPIASRSMVALVEGNKDRPSPEMSADFIADVFNQVSTKFSPSERPSTPKDATGKVIEDNPDRYKNAKARFRELFAEMYKVIDKKKFEGFSATSVARIVTFEDSDYIVTATVGNIPIFVVKSDGSIERVSAEDLDQTHSIGADSKTRDPKIVAIPMPDNVVGVLVASTTLVKRLGSMEQLEKSVKGAMQNNISDAEDISKHIVTGAIEEAQRQRPNAKNSDEYSAVFLKVGNFEQTKRQLKLGENLGSRFTSENMATLTRVFRTLTDLRDEDPMNNKVATETLEKIRPIVMGVDSPNSDVQTKIRGLVIRKGYTRESIEDKVSKLFELDSLPEEYKLKETIIGLLADKVADIWGLTL